MPKPSRTSNLLLGCALSAAILAPGCGSDDDGASGAGDAATVVVTTSVLGHVVANLLGDAAEVEVVMEPGVDPHEFQPSAQQVAAMREADVLVANGAGFEEGLESTIDAAAADGTTVCEAMDGITGLADESDDHESGDGGSPSEESHSDHSADEHSDEGDDHSDG